MKLECDWESLMVYSLGHGSTVLGDLQITYIGDVINTNVYGQVIEREINYKVTDLGGQPLPVRINKIRTIKSETAMFILVVESSVMLIALHRCNFEKRYRCIIVNGSGEASVSTRKFIKRLSLDLKLPVLVVTDGDMYGLNILTTYRYGSKALAYDSKSLAIPPRLSWLGIRRSDYGNKDYDLPEICLKRMSDADFVLLTRMMNEDCIQQNVPWMNELQIMYDTHTEVDMFRSVEKHSEYFAEIFLPAKLKKGDWI